MYAEVETNCRFIVSYEVLVMMFSKITNPDFVASKLLKAAIHIRRE